MTARQFTSNPAVFGVASALLLAGATLAGCKSPEEPPPVEQPPPTNRPPVESVDEIAAGTDFWAPLDATPSPTADRVFFTASTEDGAAIFSVSSAGGAPTRLAVGEPLVSPFGIVSSTDGNTIYIVDTAAEVEGSDGLGRIFSIPASGGTPIALDRADGTTPRSLDLVKQSGVDVIFFTGTDPTAENAPAVFKMNADGSNLSVVRRGAPLMDPSGISVSADGTIYVADSEAANNGSAGVLRISGTDVTVLASDLRLGYPAGIALDFDEEALFVSGLEPELGHSVVFRVVLATGEVAMFSDGISQNSESAGVHRAHAANVYAWADSDGSDRLPGGRVYLIKGGPIRSGGN